jgi:hypothetical protein
MRDIFRIYSQSNEEIIEDIYGFNILEEEE